MKNKIKRYPNTRTLKIELDSDSGEFIRFVNLKQVCRGISSIMVADWFQDIERMAMEVKESGWDYFLKEVQKMQKKYRQEMKKYEDNNKIN